MDENSVTESTQAAPTSTGADSSTTAAAQVEQVEELLVEEISIDGMCGVY